MFFKEKFQMYFFPQRYCALFFNFSQNQIFYELIFIFHFFSCFFFFGIFSPSENKKKSKKIFKVVKNRGLGKKVKRKTFKKKSKIFLRKQIWNFLRKKYFFSKNFAKSLSHGSSFMMGPKTHYNQIKKKSPNVSFFVKQIYVFLHKGP